MDAWAEECAAANPQRQHEAASAEDGAGPLPSGPASSSSQGFGIYGAARRRGNVVGGRLLNNLIRQHRRQVRGAESVPNPVKQEADDEKAECEQVPVAGVAADGRSKPSASALLTRAGASWLQSAFAFLALRGAKHQEAGSAMPVLADAPDVKDETLQTECAASLAVLSGLLFIGIVDLAGGIYKKYSDRVRVSTNCKFTYPGGMCKKNLT